MYACMCVFCTWEQWRNAAKKKQEEDDFSFARELRDREKRLQALEEQLEQRARSYSFCSHSCFVFFLPPSIDDSICKDFILYIYIYIYIYKICPNCVQARRGISSNSICRWLD